MATEKIPDLTLMSGDIQVDVQVAANVSNVPTESDIRNWLEQVIAQVANDTARSIVCCRAKFRFEERGQDFE